MTRVGADKIEKLGVLCDGEVWCAYLSARDPSIFAIIVRRWHVTLVGFVQRRLLQEDRRENSGVAEEIVQQAWLRLARSGLGEVTGSMRNILCRFARCEWKNYLTRSRSAPTVAVGPELSKPGREAQSKAAHRAMQAWADSGQKTPEEAFALREWARIIWLDLSAAERDAALRRLDLVDSSPPNMRRLPGQQGWSEDPLSDSERELFEHLLAFMRARGRSPTRAELGELSGRTIAAVRGVERALAGRGWLEIISRRGATERAIRVLSTPDGSEVPVTVESALPAAPVETASGLSPRQLQVLRAVVALLVETPAGVSALDVGARVGIAADNASVVLRTLEKNGWIRRVVDGTSARVVEVLKLPEAA